MFLIFNCHESVVVINGSIFLNKHMQSFSLRVDSSLFASSLSSILIPFFPSNLTSITSSKLSFSSNSHLLTLFFKTQLLSSGLLQNPTVTYTHSKDKISFKFSPPRLYQSSPLHVPFIPLCFSKLSPLCLLSDQHTTTSSPPQLERYPATHFSKHIFMVDCFVMRSGSFHCLPCDCRDKRTK